MRVSFENARHTEVWKLRKLWSEVFHDEEWYLDLFFGNIFDRENTLVGKIEDKVAAMLYMVPYKLKYENNVCEAMYLYALATDESFRRKGIMTELIKKSEKIVEDLGYIGSFLVPAEESLFSYYEDLGFNKIIGSNCQNYIILNEKQRFVNEKVILHEKQLSESENIKNEDNGNVNDVIIKGLFRSNKQLPHIVNKKHMDIYIKGVLL